jgi:hypothetical protein
MPHLGERNEESACKSCWISSLVSLLRLTLGAIHKMTKTSRTNAVKAEGNHKIARGLLTKGRAGRDSYHAPPRRTLNNLPPLFMSTKEKPVLADTPANFLRFPQHPVYNFTGRTGTESKAGRRRWKNSQEYYYCDRLTISVWNARILEINC